MQKTDISRNAMLLAAAMALPAINSAHAESAPEHGIISFKYLDYLDRQDENTDSFSGASSSGGSDRIRVRAPSIMVMAPIAGEWSVTGTYTADTVTGATPAFHTSGLSRMNERRDAASLGLTRYLPRGTITIGTNYSHEHDYLARGFSLNGTIASEDKNTTFNAGIAVSNDKINPSNHAFVGETKHVTDWIVGVTQVMTMNDIMQLDLGYSNGHGYFSDPYKSGDHRPDARDHTTLLGRWNHHFDRTGGSSHLSYRYYTDTYGIQAHTLEAEYVQPFGNGWTITPLTRFHTQTSADFYADVKTTDPAFASYLSRKYLSLDQRLAEYGAWTWGVKIAKQLNPDWFVDVKYEQYRQKENWALTNNDDSILEPFSYRSIQLGISRKF